MPAVGRRGGWAPYQTAASGVTAVWFPRERGAGTARTEGQLGAREERERPTFSDTAVQSAACSCGQKTKLARYHEALCCEVMCEKAKHYRNYHEKTPQSPGASKAFLNRRYTKSNCKGTFYLVTSKSSVKWERKARRRYLQTNTW